MLPWLRDSYGNASSIYRLGRESRVAIESARTEIAHLINAHPAELIFTSGGTESNNTIIKSAVIDSNLVDRIFYSPTEHHAVLAPIESLPETLPERSPLTSSLTNSLPVNEWGEVSLPALANANSPRTLVSVMHVNNETGTIQPLTKIREAVPDAYFHSDAVQSFGKIPVDVQELGVDFLTMSAHKIHGPKGVGAMFIRKGIDFKAHQQGGGQERNRRAGTEPVALIVGFQVAARMAIAEMEQRARIMRERTDLAIRLLVEMIPNIRLNMQKENRAPHIVNVSFLDAERLDGEAILQAMDIQGVAVSNGSACVSGSLQPSHVLKAMGRSDAESKAAVRFSVSHMTTEEEIHTAVTILSDVCRNMRVTTHI